MGVGDSHCFNRPRLTPIPYQAAGVGNRARRIPDIRAADLQEEMAEQRFFVPTAPTKTAATQRASQRAIEQSAMRERSINGTI